MCLIKTAICVECDRVFLGSEKIGGTWKKTRCHNTDCLRWSRLGAAAHLKGSYPCSSACDSEPCGNILSYFFTCSECNLAIA
jgi:hypothetical protein